MTLRFIGPGGQEARILGPKGGGFQSKGPKPLNPTPETLPYTSTEVQCFLRLAYGTVAVLTPSLNPHLKLSHLISIDFGVELLSGCCC